MNLGERELNIIAVLLFLIFIVTKISIFGFIATLILIYATIYPSFKRGIKHGIIDLLQSIIFAVVVLFLLGIFLQTSAPLDVNVSCSMRPAMERGDLIVLRGFESNNLPTIELANYSDWRKINVLKRPCNVTIAGKRILRICSYAIEYNGTTIYENHSNPVIIYEPKETDYFAATGSIVHRVFALLISDGKRYVLTKGDNNIMLDQEAGNEPVSLDRIKGQIVFQIPYLGYVKLFAFGQIEPPPECEIVIEEQK